MPIDYSTILLGILETTSERCIKIYQAMPFKPHTCTLKLFLNPDLMKAFHNLTYKDIKGKRFRFTLKDQCPSLDKLNSIHLLEIKVGVWNVEGEIVIEYTCEHFPSVDYKDILDNHWRFVWMEKLPLDKVFDLHYPEDYGEMLDNIVKGK